jgi:hypothetical protein
MPMPRLAGRPTPNLQPVLVEPSTAARGDAAATRTQEFNGFRLEAVCSCIIQASVLAEKKLGSPAVP